VIGLGVHFARMLTQQVGSTERMSLPASARDLDDRPFHGEVEPTWFFRVPNFPLHIDMDLSQLVKTLTSSLLPWQRSYVEKSLVNIWANNARTVPSSDLRSAEVNPDFKSLLERCPTSPQDQLLVTLSARSALDLWLRIKRFPRGSVVLMSAINIPTMSAVLQHHGLVPLPIDLDLETLEPIGFPQTSADIETCLIGQLVSTLGTTQRQRGDRSHASNPPTTRSGSRDPGAEMPGRICCVLVAHLFGRRFAMDPIAALCQHFGIPLIEDLAEAYADGSYPGHPCSDLALFSFGTIKNSTAFGCGVARVRSMQDFEAMQQLHDQYPTQGRTAFLKKTLKNALIMLLLNTWAGAGVATAARFAGIDYKASVVSALRGFPGPLIPSLRVRPSAPQLATLTRRLDEPTTCANVERTRHCARFFEHLVVEFKADVQLVAPKAPVREFWLFPIIVRHPTGFIDRMRQLGVDVYHGATQLAVVPCPQIDACANSQPSDQAVQATLQLLGDFPYPKSSDEFMNHVVYLPINRRCTDENLVKIARAVRVAAGPVQCNPIMEPHQTKNYVLDSYLTYLSKLKLRVFDYRPVSSAPPHPPPSPSFPPSPSPLPPVSASSAIQPTITTRITTSLHPTYQHSIISAAERNTTVGRPVQPITSFGKSLL